MFDTSEPPRRYMADLSLLLVVASTITLLAGALVTTLAVRAARRTETRTLWAFAVGLALITAGTATSWTVTASAASRVNALDVAMSAFPAAGFTVMAYSLYLDERPH
ncbi:MAG: hypothetical protein ABEJ76_07605 [Halanaeroarchaeum sp.]